LSLPLSFRRRQFPSGVVQFLLRVARFLLGVRGLFGESGDPGRLRRIVGWSGRGLLRQQFRLALCKIEGETEDLLRQLMFVVEECRFGRVVCELLCLVELLMPVDRLLQELDGLIRGGKIRRLVELLHR